MSAARPLRGTVRRIAECAECEAMLQDHGRGWTHADTGEVACDGVSPGVDIDHGFDVVAQQHNAAVARGRWR